VEPTSQAAFETSYPPPSRTADAATSKPNTASKTTIATSCTSSLLATGPSPYSKIADIINALPSGALTSVISKPTNSATPKFYNGSESTNWGDKPNKELPEGWTLKDLLQWTSYSLKQAWGDMKGGKKHSRDFQSM
jgi:hypothetical protein